MTRRFVISLDGSTAAQQDAITGWLRTTPLGFWHYLSQTWLVVDRANTYTAGTLRDQIQKLVPGWNMLIMDVTAADPDQWAGFASQPAGVWLNTEWIRP